MKLYSLIKTYTSVFEKIHSGVHLCLRWTLRCVGKCIALFDNVFKRYFKKTRQIEFKFAYFYPLFPNKTQILCQINDYFLVYHKGDRKKSISFVVKFPLYGLI